MSQPPLTSPLNYATPLPPGFGPGRNPNRFRRGLFGWLVFLGLAFMLLMLVSQSKKVPTDEIPLSEFHAHLIAGDVLSLKVEGDDVAGLFRSPITVVGMSVPVTHFRSSLPAGATGSWEFTEWILQNRNGAKIEVSNDRGIFISIVLPLVPWILIFGFVWFLISRSQRRAAASSRPTVLAGPVEVIVLNRESK